MLVLSRYVDDQIMIGEGENMVKLKVLKITGNRVRLGLSGDPKIPIHRKEVYDTIRHGELPPEPELRERKGKVEA